jgi:hypothetical protein
MSKHMYVAICPYTCTKESCLLLVAGREFPQRCVTRVQGHMTMPVLSCRVEENEFKASLDQVALQQQTLTSPVGFLILDFCLSYGLQHVLSKESLHCGNIRQF